MAREHELSEDCWCNPEIIEYSASGQRVVRHRKPEKKDDSAVPSTDT